MAWSHEGAGGAPGVRVGDDGRVSATEHREIERKYDVEAGAALPSLVTMPGVDRVEQRPPVELDAIYLDTDDLALARARITLRRRTGGGDEGWHLKLPARKDVRRELHAPLAIHNLDT